MENTCYTFISNSIMKIKNFHSANIHFFLLKIIKNSALIFMQFLIYLFSHGKYLLYHIPSWKSIIFTLQIFAQTTGNFDAQMWENQLTH